MNSKDAARNFQLSVQVQCHPMQWVDIWMRQLAGISLIQVAPVLGQLPKQFGRELKSYVLS